MAKYIFKRTLYMILVLFIVTTATFFLVHSIPGDPITMMVDDLPLESRDLYLAKYGFDKPITEQYLLFMKQLVQGDLGQSLRYPGRKVMSIAATTAPVSTIIGGVGLAMGFVLGIALGIVAALNRNRWPDKLVMLVAMLGTTLPTFFLAATLQYALTVTWPIFPTTGWGGVKYMVLPIMCMCVDPLATYARYMRSSVLDVCSQDYILTAEAKGVSEFRIITRHIFRNSFLPCITMICVSISGVFFGSFIVESIFAIPGMGRYFISAISDRDYSMILGLNLIMTGVYIAFILLSDILMVLADPRIRFSADL